MLTLDDYLDLAKKRHAIRSDRQLCLRLGVTAPIVYQMRHGHMKPSDATMIRLADLAGLDTAEALCSLRQWKAQSPDVAEHWRRIGDLVIAASKGAASALVLFSLSGLAVPDSAVSAEADNAPSVYYGKYLWRFVLALRRLARPAWRTSPVS